MPGIFNDRAINVCRNRNNFIYTCGKATVKPQAKTMAAIQSILATAKYKNSLELFRIKNLIVFIDEMK